MDMAAIGNNSSFFEIYLKLSHIKRLEMHKLQGKKLIKGCNIETDKAVYTVIGLLSKLI